MSAKYLFVCHANWSRSPYAAEWFSEYCKRSNIEAEVMSAGLKVEPAEIDCRRINLNNEIVKWTRTSLDPELVNWADEIIVMEEYMKEEINQKYPNTKRIVVLNIPDYFLQNIQDPENESIEEIQKIVNYSKWFGRTWFSKLLENKLELILGTNNASEKVLQ